MGSTKAPPRPPTLRSSHTFQDHPRQTHRLFLQFPCPCSLRQRSPGNLACRMELQAMSITCARTGTTRRREGSPHSHPPPPPPQGEARPPARPWAKACAHTHTHKGTRRLPHPPNCPDSNFRESGTSALRRGAPACACALRSLSKGAPGSERRARPVLAGLPCNRGPGDTAASLSTRPGTLEAHR